VDERLAEFREQFGEFVRVSLEAEARSEPQFRVLLRDHLGAEPSDLPVLAEEVALWDHANLQFALEALLAANERSVRLVGIGGGQKRFMALSLSDLINERHFRPGPVEYENVPVAPGRSHPCILFGLALLRDETGPGVLLVRRGDAHGPSPGLQVEAMTPDEERAAELLGELRELMRAHNVFRGQMISLESTMWNQVRVAFHERPALRRDDVILPEQVLGDIERHTLRIGKQAQALRAAGRHLKRGLLLHGPPGTGKTHTVKWLAAELSNATVIVLAGGSLGVSGPVCRLARELAPSLVVLEDIDLVAEERTMMPPQAGPVLFELLNELDGLGDDADVAVVLTTNRPDLLEPALAARPGRVDLAVEVPLPDDSCRRRLIELYATGLALDLRDPDAIVERTAGVTASFFRELLRQAALEAAEQGCASVRDEHVAAALDRLLHHAGTMTRILLGASPPAPDRSSLDASRAWLTATQLDDM
jgi:SpoVK/Ycf46/Vps4 family AAA+-type ATPase